MDNFDLKKYLAEGRLLKEELSDSEISEKIEWDWHKARDYYDDDEGTIYKVWGRDDSNTYYANFFLADKGRKKRDINDQQSRQEFGNFTYVSQWSKDGETKIDELNPEDVFIS